jgi:copper resistance protein C
MLFWDYQGPAFSDAKSLREGLKEVMPAKKVFTAALFLSALFLIPRIAFAHAVLISSTPAANAVVQGQNAAVELRFNSRVDGQRSRLTLVLSDGQTQPLPLDRQGAATSLNSHLTLRPGRYIIRWQALSTDGHITRGEIPFTVR